MSRTVPVLLASAGFALAVSCSRPALFQRLDQYFRTSSFAVESFRIFITQSDDAIRMLQGARTGT